MSQDPEKKREYQARYREERREHYRELQRQSNKRRRKHRNEMMRRWWMENHEEHRRRQRCREKLWRAVKRGDVVPQPCEVCGDPKSEAHHADYEKPFDVRWLCKAHHYQADLADRTLLNSS